MNKGGGSKRRQLKIPSELESATLKLSAVSSDTGNQTGLSSAGLILEPQQARTDDY